MAYKSTHPLFRDLSDEEERQFREHARKEPPEDITNWEIYHPVCREEWEKRGISPTIIAKKLLSTIRGQYIISQALCLAIESIEGRPEEKQEPSNVLDMKLLTYLFPIYKTVQGVGNPHLDEEGV